MRSSAVKVLSVVYVADLLGRVLSHSLGFSPGWQRVLPVTLSGAVILVVLGLLIVERKALVYQDGVGKLLALMAVTAVVGGVVGVFNSTWWRYWLADIWKLLYFPALYLVIVTVLKPRDALPLLLITIGWGISRHLIPIIAAGRGAMGSGMPYIVVGGVVAVLLGYRILGGLTVAVGLLFTIASGRRTALIIALTAVLASAFAFTRRQVAIGVTVVLALVTAGGLYLDRGGVVAPQPVLDGLQRQKTILRRVEDSESWYEGNRFLEATAVYKTYLKDATVPTSVLGMGAGATWDASFVPEGVGASPRNGAVHTIHVTPLAYSYRYGLLGIVLTVLLYLVFLADATQVFRQTVGITSNTSPLYIAKVGSAIMLGATVIYSLSGPNLLHPGVQLPLPVYFAVARLRER